MPTNAEVRTQKRIDAVKSVQRGEEPKLVARVMGIPMTTLYDWLARYRGGGWDALGEGVRSGRPRKVTGSVLSWLYNAITGGDPRQYQFEFFLWNRRIIRSMLKKHHGIELSVSSIGRLLRQLGLSAQRPIYKAYQQDKTAVKQWLEQTYPNLFARARKLKATLCFADEASFRSDSHRGTTWGAIGQTPVVEEHRGRFGINCISAISAKGEMRFKCFEGRMNSDGFIDFLKALHSDSGMPVFVIVDGASYHSSRKVKDYVKSTEGKVELFKLPAYSPELNPDEQVWNQAKSNIGKMAIESKSMMRKAVLRAMRSIQKSRQLIKAFFKLEHTKYAQV